MCWKWSRVRSIRHFIDLRIVGGSLLFGARARTIARPSSTTLRRQGRSSWCMRRIVGNRSEERRVGKECRSRWGPEHLKKKKNFQAASRENVGAADDQAKIRGRG